MYEFLKYYNLNIKIIATKFDKVKKSAREKQNKIIKDSLKLSEEEEIITFSTISKKGRDEVYDLISKLI